MRLDPIKTVLFITLGMFFIVGPTRAQAGIRGEVKDVLGGPVAGAAIRVYGPEGRRRQVLTDQQGRFHFVGLRRGAYTVEVKLGGLIKELRERTVVQPNRLTTYNIVLKFTRCPPGEQLSCRPRMVEATSPPLLPQG